MKNTIKLATTLVLFSSVLGSVTAFADGFDEAKTKGSVEFIIGDGGNEKPVDPEEKPSKPIEPGEVPGGGTGNTGGPLQIVFAPNLDFGTQKISSQDQTYTAALQTVQGLDEDGTPTGPEKERANFVQVSDVTGDQAGWNLKLSQTAQLSDGESDLEGAVISFKNAKVQEKSNNLQAEVGFSGELKLTPGSEALIMNADEGKGMGNNSLSFGNASEDLETAMNSVTLFVPESAIQKKAVYTADLVWTLEQGPANTEA